MKLHNKSVFITGADGFIGSHLAEAAVRAGARVKALAYYNSFNDWGWLEEVPCLKDIEVVAGDVRDPHFCRTVTRGIDIVFHLAALIGIPYSYNAPDSYVDTNVRGTLNICQAALENGCSKLVHTSTSEVYGSARYVPIDELHPLQAQSPYSASKIGADAIAMSFFHSFDLPVAIARPFNTYGPRQSARAIIPTIITQLASGKKQIALGSLAPTRDLNYVADTCRGLLLIAASEKTVGETVNIGSGTETAMEDVFKLIREIMQIEAEAVLDTDRLRPDKSEVARLCCDNKKIHALTGFVPEVALRTGLESTIHWFMQGSGARRYKSQLYTV